MLEFSGFTNWLDKKKRIDSDHLKRALRIWHIFYMEKLIQCDSSASYAVRDGDGAKD